ncbi:TPA: hypothetical protein SMN35_001136 [Proteus mirabilis]
MPVFQKDYIIFLIIVVIVIVLVIYALKYKKINNIILPIGALAGTYSAFFWVVVTFFPDSPLSEYNNRSASISGLVSAICVYLSLFSSLSNSNSEYKIKQTEIDREIMKLKNSISKSDSKINALYEYIKITQEQKNNNINELDSKFINKDKTENNTKQPDDK